MTKERIPQKTHWLIWPLIGVPILLALYQIFSSAGFYPSANWMRLFNVSTILFGGFLFFIRPSILRKSGKAPPLHPNHNPWISGILGIISLYVFWWMGYAHGAASVLTRLIGEETRQTYTVNVRSGGRHADRAYITSLEGFAFRKPAISDDDFKKFRYQQDIKVELDSHVSWFGTRFEGYQPLQEVTDR